MCDHFTICHGPLTSSLLSSMLHPSHGMHCAFCGLKKQENRTMICSKPQEWGSQVWDNHHHHNNKIAQIGATWGNVLKIMATKLASTKQKSNDSPLSSKHQIKNRWSKTTYQHCKKMVIFIHKPYSPKHLLRQYLECFVYTFSDDIWNSREYIYVYIIYNIYNI